MKYQIKHYFDLSNCKFTRSFLISAIWRGSPCRRSSDDANTDWVHCPSPRCRVKVADCAACDLEPTSARRWVCDVTVATDANVVTMSPDVALLAGLVLTSSIDVVFVLSIRITRWIDMESKGCESIGYWTQVVILNFDLIHDIDLWFTMSTFS